MDILLGQGIKDEFLRRKGADEKVMRSNTKSHVDRTEPGDAKKSTKDVLMMMKGNNSLKCSPDR